MKLEMKTDVVYRCIGSDFANGILASGFMSKPTKEHSQYNFLINYYSWFFLISGNGYYITSEGEKIPLHPGSIVQRMPGICHSTEIIPDGNWLEFFISIGKSTYDYLCSLNLLPINTPVFNVVQDDSTLLRFIRFLDQLKEAKDNDLPYLSLIAQEIILSVSSYAQNTAYYGTRIDSMEEACRLLSSDANTDTPLLEIAASVHMSYESFRKLFYKHTGLSPERYRIEQKMKRARLMLISGVSIKETSLLTGYSDTYSFTKQFTHTVGIPPGRFIMEAIHGQEHVPTQHTIN